MEDRCPQCGAERPPNDEWGQKLCPACLMKLGMSGEIPAIPASEPETAAATAPPRSKERWRWNWRWVARAAVVAALLALVTIAVRHFTERAEPQRVIHLV